MTKEDFLNKYNKPRTIEKALNESINAAIKRNPFYNNVSHEEKKHIKDVWKEWLKTSAKKFAEEKWDEKKYEEEIENLKLYMKEKFGLLINFRISHAQKSIGVFFKHLWCLEKIPTPPQCPVDRVILTKAGANYNERSWGKVDTIDQHRKKYSFIKKAANKAGFEHASEWELINFG